MPVQGSTIAPESLSIRYYTYYIILRINTVSIMGTRRTSQRMRRGNTYLAAGNRRQMRRLNTSLRNSLAVLRYTVMGLSLLLL